MPKQTANDNSQAIIPYVGRATPAVQDNNVNLVLHLFDTNAERHLHHSFIDDAMDADALDSSWGLKENGTQPNLKKLYMDRLLKVNKQDDNCPIVLQAVTFNVFSNYLVTKRSKKSHILSKSTYSGLRSALTHLHKISGQEIPAEFQQYMSTFSRGIKRKVTQEKLESGLSLEEGKKEMNFDVYKLMCRKMLEMNSKEGPFAHLFLILEWNLMACASNCMDFRLRHIE